MVKKKRRRQQALKDAKKREKQIEKAKKKIKNKKKVEDKAKEVQKEANKIKKKKKGGFNPIRKRETAEGAVEPARELGDKAYERYEKLSKEMYEKGANTEKLREKQEKLNKIANMAGEEERARKEMKRQEEAQPTKGMEKKINNIAKKGRKQIKKGNKAVGKALEDVARGKNPKEVEEKIKGERAKKGFRTLLEEEGIATTEERAGELEEKKRKR